VKEKRHAVLLCGFTRNYKKHIDSFKKNNMHQNDVDLFICFWDQIAGHPKNIKHANYDLINEEKLKLDYNPTQIKIFEWSSFGDVIKASSKIIAASNLCHTPKLFAKVDRVIGQHFLLNQAFKMMESYQNANNIEYVNILRTRTEFSYNNTGGYYPKINWNKNYDDAIYIPKWNFVKRGKYKKIASNAAISSFDNMKVYCDLINDLPSISQTFIDNHTKAWGDEYCIAIHLTKHKIQWEALQ